MTQYKMDALRRIQAETCKTFGNPKRLLIIEKIWDREISYRDLLDETGLDKVTLTQQTSLMRRKGILNAERTGGTLVFSVANPKVLEAFTLMRQVIIERIENDSDLLSAVSE